MDRTIICLLFLAAYSLPQVLARLLLTEKSAREQARWAEMGLDLLRRYSR